MLKCDYKALDEKAATLNKIFNETNEIFLKIENSYKNIYSSENWNSLTREYFYDKVKRIIENDDAFMNKFFNVKQYLDSVVDNYAINEAKLNNIFKW